MTATKARPKRWYRPKRWVAPPPYYKFLAEREAARAQTTQPHEVTTHV